MEEFRQGFQQLVHNIAIQAALDKFDPLVARIEDAKKAYGREFATKGIDVSANPFPSAGSWTDLSEKWLKRKGASLGNQRFYRGLSPSGESLEDALYAMPTEQIFGKTQITAKAEVAPSAGFFNPRIKRQIDTVFRNYQGRFASQQSYDTSKQVVRVTIKPFPNIQLGESMIKQLPMSLKQRRKLLGNDPTRPLTEAFTDWFYQNKIKFAIEQGLKEL